MKNLLTMDIPHLKRKKLPMKLGLDMQNWADLMAKSAPYQKALRDRRKSEGLKTLIRYVKPEWIPAIDQLIKQLENNHEH